jgi:hypothetical protein
VIPRRHPSEIARFLQRPRRIDLEARPSATGALNPNREGQSEPHLQAVRSGPTSPSGVSVDGHDHNKFAVSRWEFPCYDELLVCSVWAGVSHSPAGQAFLDRQARREGRIQKTFPDKFPDRREFARTPMIAKRNDASPRASFGVRFAPVARLEEIRVIEGRRAPRAQSTNAGGPPSAPDRAGC